jgi:hypothetical protein
LNGGKTTKGMQLQSFTVSDKLKDKGHLGMYFTKTGGKEFKKMWHLK